VSQKLSKSALSKLSFLFVPLVWICKSHFRHSEQIPLPKIKTQKQIIAQLDQLQTQTKKLETIYQQKINNLVELKKTILILSNINL
jgi:hypothetical protein